VPVSDVSAPSWQMPFPLVLESFQGASWFDAATIYRRFIERSAAWLLAPRVPQRLDDVDIVINTGWSFIDILDPSQGLCSTALRDAQEARALFPNSTILMHWYVWWNGAFDKGYPDVFASPRANFSAAVAAIQQLGVRVMPYINGRSFDVTLASFAAAAPQMIQSLAENGSLFVGSVDYGNGAPLATVCPSQRSWTTLIPKVVQSLASARVDAVYIDQIAAAEPLSCFSASHGHPVGGGSSWVAGNRQLLAQSARVAPIVTENSAEPYVGAADAFLTVASWIGLPNVDVELAPLFQAVYANVTTVGRIYEPADVTNPPHFCAKTAQSLLYGSLLGWMSWRGLLGVGDALANASTSVLCANRLAEWRQALRPWFRGRRLRDVALVNEASLPVIPTLFGAYAAVQTAAWTAGGGVAVMLVSSWRAALPAHVSLDSAQYELDPSATHTATLLRRDGSTAPLASFTAKFDWSASVAAYDGVAVILQ